MRLLLPITLTSVGGTVFLGATVAKVSNNQRAHDYYASLDKPPGNPPTWALGPIWGTLYGMLGYVAHDLVRLADSHPTIGGEARAALGLYYVQLALNFVYMPIFFQVQSREVALADIVAITGLTLKLVVSGGSAMALTPGRHEGAAQPGIPPPPPVRGVDGLLYVQTWPG